MDAAPTLRIQIKIHAAIDTVYQALTTSAALETWLAESAAVDLKAGHFSYWGKYTPANPSKDSQHMTLIEHKPNRLLKFTWQIRDDATTVTIKLPPESDNDRNDNNNY